MINVAAGTYGVLALAENDQHWVLDDAAEFSGMTFTGNPTRVIVEGGVIDAGTSTDIQVLATDLLLKNVDMSCQNGIIGNSSNDLVTRFACVHCTITAQVYPWFCWNPAAAGAGYHTDIIMAGNLFYGGQDGGNPANILRIQSVQRFICVDNRGRSNLDGDDADHSWRSHYGCSDYWLRRNLADHASGFFHMPDTDATPDSNEYLGDHWLYDNLHYYDGPDQVGKTCAIRLDVTATYYPGDLIAEDNISYRSNQTNPAGVEDFQMTWNAQAGDTISGNIVYPYEEPPALNAWLAADSVQPGADH